MSLCLNHKTLAATLVLLCAACAAPHDSAEPAKAPKLTELQNASFSGLASLPDLVHLQNGRWQAAPHEPGAASRDIVTLDDALHVVGDLDADGQAEAVVHLTHSAGATAQWSYLAVVKRLGKQLDNVATVALGDRVQIRSLQINDGKLQASLVRAGPGDPACCPGELADLGWSLADGHLKAQDDIKTGRLTLDALAGTNWVLHAWGVAEPAATQPEVTLSYAAGRFTGHSGCNRYTTGVTPGTLPGELKVGLVAGTRMACPDAVSSAETRFLERLQTARRFDFRSGRLAITSSGSEGPNTMMLFEAIAPATPK